MLHNYGCKSRTYYQDKQTNGGLFALFLLIFLVFVQESRQNSPILSVCPCFLAPEVVKGMQRCRLQRHERRPLIFSEVVSSTSEVVLFFSEVNETTSERNPLRSDFASRTRTRAYTTCKTLFFAFTAFTQIHNPLSMRGLSVKGNPVKEVKDGRPFAFTRNPLYMRHLQPR